MGRPKGSKNKKTIAASISSAKPKPMTVTPSKPNARKRNMLIEDSASEDGGSSASANSVTSDTSGSLNDFVVEEDVEEEEEGVTTQMQYLHESLAEDEVPPNGERPIGHDAYPVNEFSLTVTKIKGDVHLAAASCVHSFIKEFCIKGCVNNSCIYTTD